MLYRGSRFFSIVACITFLLGTGVFNLSAQQKTLTRKYDPIVFPVYGSSPAYGLPIAEVTAYRYDAAQDQFEIIPFQVDERDSTFKYFVEQNGVIDDYDEIVFMPGDAGDRAGTDKWLNDAGAIANPRVEFEITDPLDPSQKAWVYFFRGVSNPPPAPPSYMSYIADPQGTGADTIQGASYISSHDAKNGLPNFARIKQDNGSFSPNLLDQLKLRINGVALGILAYKANEADNLDSAYVRSSAGPLRVIREANVNLIHPLFGKLLTFPIPIHYFPYSSLVSFRNAKIDPSQANTFGANLLRQSLDFSSDVAGTNMKFYNAYNTAGLSIDGQPDAANTKVDTSKINWMIASGNLASFIALVSVPAIGTSQQLYFYDNLNGGTGEGGSVTVDTGDFKSYGDFGIRINGTNISGQFSFDFSMYYLNALPGSDPATIGNQFKSYQENAVEVTAVQQGNTSAVTTPRTDPNSFALYDAYPNPFTPVKERVRIAFNTGATKALADLRIYNLVGQEVARFTSRDAIRASGRQELSWNGVDRYGRALPAGVYFYRLQVGKQVAIKKLVLVR